MTGENEDDAVRAAETAREYPLLTALDGKAAALLTFNAIFITAISVWLGYVGPNWLHFVLDLIFVTVLISSGLLLSVIHLIWVDEPEFAREDLRRMRMVRSRRYRAALTLCEVAVVATLAVSALHTAGTGLKVAGACDDACARFFSEEVFGNLDGGA
ncbi:MAG: hypothetical protein R6V44_04335 [Paracoccaceae bacterium]